MTTNVLKAILIGFLAGVLLFFIPFLLFRALFIVLIIGVILRLSGFRRRWRYGGHGFWNNPNYIQRWYNMNEHERKAFKEKMERELFAAPSNNR